jgi:hypothetical protein
VTTDVTYQDHSQSTSITYRLTIVSPICFFRCKNKVSRDYNKHFQQQQQQPHQRSQTSPFIERNKAQEGDPKPQTKRPQKKFAEKVRKSYW